MAVYTFRGNKKREDWSELVVDGGEVVEAGVTVLTCGARGGVTPRQMCGFGCAGVHGIVGH